MDIQDRVALVTGGGTGIGAAVARRLAADGARVAVMGRRREPLEKVAREIRKRWPRARPLAVQGDVSMESGVRACIARVERGLGPVDILVNNAAILKLGRVEEADLRDLREMMEVNYFGAVRTARAVLPGMRRRGRGHIVAVASVGARKSFPGYGGYDATKFAVAGFMDGLRQELHGTGVGASLVLPGAVETEMGRAFAERSPAARRMMVSPDSVADAVLDAVRRNLAQVYVPRFLQTVALLNELSPRTADWLVRIARG